MSGRRNFEFLMISTATLICSQDIYADKAISQPPIFGSLFGSRSKDKKSGNDKNKKNDLTPAVSKCLDKGQGPFFSIEFLYWHVSEDSLEIAIQIPGGSPAQGSPSKVLSLEQEFKWNPGARATFGYNLPYYGWDILARWTNIYSNPSTKISENRGIISPFIYTEAVINGGSDEVAPASELHTKWRLQFNIIDLDFGRHYYISRSLSLRPHAGLKNAWIYQHFKLHGNFIPGDGRTLGTTFTALNKFWGIGPSVGADARWALPSHWGVFFDVALAGLIGKFRTQGKFSDTLAADNQGNISSTDATIKIISNRNRLVPMLQLFIGFDWSKCFHASNKYISLFAGYEIQYWWNQNRFPTFEEILLHRSPVGDLMMHGLSTGLRLDF